MISIAMSYYNRLPQLEHTLKTIQSSRVKDVEIVIVDDFSDSKHSLDDLCDRYPNLNLQVIKMKDRQSRKTYTNPSVPYNVALAACQGDKIIIQNPECCHMGDVLAYVEQHLDDHRYLSFHCYACTKDDCRDLYAGREITMFSHKKAKWYNHETERPVAFHFCSAITRNNLAQLNGFDERFGQGHDYDDAELVWRIKAMGLTIQFVSDPWVIHQYHPKTYDNPHNPPVTNDNKKLYFEMMESGVIRAHNGGKNICGI